jgi:tetratricopeptide (TPR) repeat protein
MATVYRAHQPSMDRDVAIKVIHPSILSDDKQRQRFQREARLVARLEHPHILPVYDFDGAHNPPYLVMRYLQGGTLKELLAREQIPFDEIIYILHQVGAALDYSHRQGVVHRDIKPSNIMIDRDGNAFVTDFGIARKTGTDGEATISGPGSFVGTPEYMSPEQMQGNAQPDYRTDIYSLGVMLFEMLTGQLPFRSDTLMNTILAHLHQPPPLPSSYNADLSPELDSVVLQALSKQSDARQPSVTALINAVAEALGGRSAKTPLHLRTAVRKTISLKEAGPAATSEALPTLPITQNRVITALAINATDFAARSRTSEALQQFWQAAFAAIGNYGGSVIQHSQETLLALWGVDGSHENDAEQAVRAALAVRECLRSLIGSPMLPDEPLPVKIGVNTGFALLSLARPLGDMTASGATISLAARITDAAPGDVIITRDTFRYVQGIFEVLPADPVVLRRTAGREQIDAFRVIAARSRAFRLEPRSVEGVSTRMVGRDHELKQLQNAFFNMIEDGETQMVTILSEAGLGKSRLLHEFATWADLRPERYFIFRARATPGMANRPYGLWRDILSFRFEIQDSDSPATVRQKVEAGVVRLLDSGNRAAHERIAHLTGHLAGFDFTSSPYLGGTPQDVAKQAQRAVTELFTCLGQTGSVMFQLEDLHNADDASLDLLASLVATTDDLRLIVLVTARPLLEERRPSWGSGQDYHTRIDLLPLGKRESRDLVKEILQKVDDVPKDLRDLIVDRAEGNPYYIEELVKMLIEDRVIQKVDGEHWTVEASRLERLRVPPTLVGLLQARFDSLLEPERLTLQRAAVAGRIFHDGALRAIDGADALHVADLAEVLTSLTRREFVLPRETSAFADSREYVFAQTMLRDQIIETLLERQVKTYHRVMAEWLARQGGERAGEYDALIASHYEEAQEPILASDYLSRAGSTAFSLGAFGEAITLLERALTLLSDEPETTQRRLALRIRLGEVYSMKGGFEEARQHLEPALAAARDSHNASAEASALANLGRMALWGGNREAGRAYLEEALPIARDVGDMPTLVFILRQMGNLNMVADRHDEARTMLQESLELARTSGDLDSAAAALNSLGIIATVQGDIPEALQYCEEALDLARRVGNRNAIAMFNANLAELYLEQSDYDAAHRSAEECLNLAREIGSDVMIPGGLLYLGRVALHRGELDTARHLLHEAIRLAHGIKHVRRLLDCLTAYALLTARRGSSDSALELLGLVRAHPAIDGDTRRKVDRAITELSNGKTVDEVQSVLTRGAALDLNTIIEEILQTVPAL